MILEERVVRVSGRGNLPWRLRETLAAEAKVREMTAREQDLKLFDPHISLSLHMCTLTIYPTVTF